MKILLILAICITISMTNGRMLNIKPNPNKLLKKDCTIIKSPLPIPKVGMVVSNPDRAALIAKTYFEYYYIHTDFRGYRVYVGKYKQRDLFVSYIGLGSASAAFMMEELIAHDVEVIIRLGSNDFNTTIKDINKVFVVKESYNLAGLMQDYGFPDYDIDTSIPANRGLVSDIMDNAWKFPKIDVKLSVGYNIDAFYAFLDTRIAYNQTNVQNTIDYYNEKFQGKSVCRDMEAAAVLLVGAMRGIRTAAVLQSVVKHDPKAHENVGTTGILLVLETLIEQY